MAISARGVRPRLAAPQSVLRVLLVVAIVLVIVSLFLPPYKKLTQSRIEIENLESQRTIRKCCSRSRRGK